jgi:hypothetical protein
VNEEVLASYFIGSPDPKREEPMIGQRLLIQWSLPKSYRLYQTLFLRLRVRFYNRKEETVILPIDQQRGSYYYYLVNEKYCEAKGLLTYQAELIGEGQVLETFQHQLWKELILLNIDSPEQ